MNKIINNPQVFPTILRVKEITGNTFKIKDYEAEGMTLLDHFAGQALMSMLSPVQDIKESTYRKASKLAFKFARAMLIERENHI